MNYAPNQSQCYIRIPFSNLPDQQWRLEDLLSDARYDREGSDLEARGLYLDLAPWRYHVFRLKNRREAMKCDDDVCSAAALPGSV
jgi:hypothetical protein